MKQTKSGTYKSTPTIMAEVSRYPPKKYETEIGSQRTYVTRPYWHIYFKTLELKPTTPHATHESKPDQSTKTRGDLKKNYDKVEGARGLG